MYKIKQIPADFIVREINELQLDNKGNYSYFLLKKRNYNTLTAIEVLANKLKISKKNIGFAGNKDKIAVTEQFISIRNGKKDYENINLKNIELKYLGQGINEIFLGNLKGNEFKITIRNLTKKEIQKINSNKISMPNYFGPQRLSNKNHLIGKEIVNKNFDKAVNLILQTNTDYDEKIKEHLEKRSKDFVVALKIIPLKLLKFYVHAYQSFLFNKTLEQYIKNNKSSYEKIPIIGFGTEIKNTKINKIVNKILEEEKITFRDFIIRQIPELSSEGDERNALVKIKDFKVINQDKDELNKNMEKLIVTFSLPKGSYATVFIDNLFL